MQEEETPDLPMSMSIDKLMDLQKPPDLRGVPKVPIHVSDDLTLNVDEVFEHAVFGIGDGCTMRVRFAVVDERAQLIGLAIEPSAQSPARGLTAFQMRDVKWADVFRDAMMQQLLPAHLQASIGRIAAGELTDDAFLAETNAVTSTARGYARWDADLAARVLELFDDGGLDRIMSSEDVSKRTAQRWLNRARKELER